MAGWRLARRSSPLTPLASVLRHGQGEVIERGLIKSVTQMLVELGHPVYVEDFEKPFLSSAAEFYRVCSHGVG